MMGLLNLFFVGLKIWEENSRIIKKVNLWLDSLVSEKALLAFHHRVEGLEIVSFGEFPDFEGEAVLSGV